MTAEMILKPGHVTLADLGILYWQSPAVKLAPNFRPNIEAASKIVCDAANGDAAVYGVNTGFGKLASTRIPPEDTTQLQRNLILSHCCGVGEPLSENIVRLVMVLKLMSLGRGASGVRWEIIEHIQNMLEKGVSPVIPGQGSVGASGDLAPLSHFAAIMASSAPFRDEIHQLRGHAGQIDAGYALRALMDKSEIRESHRLDDDRVQDSYCIRCQPQVMGACIDLLRQTGRTLQIEANAVTDNPLILLSDGSIVSGGNFHAEPVAFAADQIALAIAEIGAISQRRIALMVDPAMNFGLPAFLTPNPGLNSGLMIAEVTSAALMSENKQKAAPCSVDSTPTSANQEDHVSMACHAARRLLDMADNLGRIVAIEMMTASQGIEFRAPLKTSALLQKVIARLRLDVATLGDDRYLAPDIERSNDLVRSNAFIDLLSDGVLPTMEFKI